MSCAGLRGSWQRRAAQCVEPAGRCRRRGRKTSMIRAAIVGIGHWGRTLVNAVQGKSDGDPVHRRAQPARAPRPRRSAPRRASRCTTASTRSSPTRRSTRSSSRRRTASMATQVERTAAAGKHVFMEKPFTLDRQQRGAGARCGGAGRGHARRRLSAPLSSRHEGAESANRRAARSARSRIAMPSRTRRPACSWTRGIVARDRRRGAGRRR